MGHTWTNFNEHFRASLYRNLSARSLGTRRRALLFRTRSDVEVAASHIAAVRLFIQARAIASVVDLGCGDFRVGSQLLTPGLKYHGVDIAAGRQAQYAFHGGPNVTFPASTLRSLSCPRANPCLVREVFQHLSNDQIARVLARCRKLVYVVVTEKVASPERFTTPNVDIVHGPNTC